MVQRYIIFLRRQAQFKVVIKLSYQRVHFFNNNKLYNSTNLEQTKKQPKQKK